MGVFVLNRVVRRFAGYLENPMTLCRRLGKRDELTKPDEFPSSDALGDDRSIRRIQEFDCKVLSMNAMPSTGKNRSGWNYLMRFIDDNDNDGQRSKTMKTKTLKTIKF